jgi:multiple sugar transport system substrate-binding protein
MTQRRLRLAALAVMLAVGGCGSAGAPAPSGPAPSGDGARKLVVWDWKSSDQSAKNYVAQAKADFAKTHPGVPVEFVAQPFDQYYTLLGAAIQAGKGPDVLLFNGGGQLRDRVGSLVPLDQYLAQDTGRLAGWDAFRQGGKTYAAPVTLQGHPVYYNKALFKRAGLDPEQPPASWEALVRDCAAITRATGAACFSQGNKEGVGIQFFMSGLGSGILTPAEYDDWIAGKRDWSSPNVKKLFQLWADAQSSGLNSKGANSTALFNDAFTTFESGKAAIMIGLMSDVGHWKDFGEFLAPADLGVMAAPVVTPGAVPSLPYDGGIGYAVAKWTPDPALAADLVRSLTSTAALTVFSADAGAIAADTTVSTAESGPAVKTIMGEVKDGKPALHVALSSTTQDLMGRLSQQLLSGSVTVDEAVRQLAAADRAG